MADSVATSLPRICLVVLMGLPGSGKTTFARHIENFLREQSNLINFGVFHMCYDQIVPLIKQKEMALVASRNDTKSLDMDSEVTDDFKICRKNFTSLIDHVLFKLKGELGNEKVIESKIDKFSLILSDLEGKENILVVIDDNNYYQSMRYEYYKLSRKHTTSFCQIYLKPSCIDTLFCNNKKRPEHETIPDEVIVKMNSKIEPPNPFENSWEQFSFSINVPEKKGESADKYLFNFNTFLDVINAALDSPIQPLPPTPLEKTEEAKAMSKNICSTNAYHISDKILRKNINVRMREAMKNEDESMAQLGQRLNKARTELLHDLKNNIIEYVPPEVIGVVTKEQDVEQDKITKANEELERILVELYELKLKAVQVQKQ